MSTKGYSRGIVIGSVLALINLPVALALIEGVSYHVRNRSNGSIISSGVEREYLLHVPGSYDRSRPTPLVISMHGGALWPAAQKEISQWDRVSDEHGFIVVYPSAVSGHGPRAWQAGGGPGLMQDVRFISELVDTLMASYNIDPARIYADGLSNGGGMTFAVSCTMSDRIAAVGMVAPAIFLPWSACNSGRAVPMIAFHGTADSAVRYQGGKSWVAPIAFPNIPAWTQKWAERNGCAPNPVDSAVAMDVIRREYTSCSDGAAVVLYTVLDGGHTWPGGGPLPEWFVGTTSNSVDATSQMWSFFSEHRLLRN